MLASHRQARLILLTGLVSVCWPRHCPAQSWNDQKVFGPFVCRAEFSLSGMESLMGELVQIQSDLVRSLGIPPSQELIHLYLFRDKNSYSRFLEQHFPKVPYRRALYLKGRGAGMVFAYRNREFEIDLRHECTHALLHASLPVVPLWLDEGLAEYFEVPARQRAFDNPHLGSLKWNLWFGGVPRLEKLEGLGSLGEMRQSEYRASWAWVHFMLHGSTTAHNELVAFLSDIRAHSPPGLLSQRLRRRLPDIEQRFAAHFKTWRR